MENDLVMLALIVVVLRFNCSNFFGLFFFIRNKPIPPPAQAQVPQTAVIKPTVAPVLFSLSSSSAIAASRLLSSGDEFTGLITIGFS